jgi:hypothetical protein
MTMATLGEDISCDVSRADWVGGAVDDNGAEAEACATEVEGAEVVGFISPV